MLAYGSSCTLRQLGASRWCAVLDAWTGAATTCTRGIRSSHSSAPLQQTCCRCDTGMGCLQGSAHWQVCGAEVDGSCVHRPSSAPSATLTATSCQTPRALRPSQTTSWAARTRSARPGERRSSAPPWRTSGAEVSSAAVLYCLPEPAGSARPCQWPWWRSALIRPSPCCRPSLAPVKFRPQVELIGRLVMTCAGCSAMTAEVFAMMAYGLRLKC